MRLPYRCPELPLGNTLRVAVGAPDEMDIMRALSGFEGRVHRLHVQTTIR